MTDKDAFDIEVMRTVANIDAAMCDELKSFAIGLSRAGLPDAEVMARVVAFAEQYLPSIMQKRADLVGLITTNDEPPN